MNSKLLIGVVVVVVVLGLGYLLNSNQDAKVIQQPVLEKPKVPKPVLEVKDIEVIGVVQKIPMPGEDKSFMYCINNADNLLVVLFDKIDGKEIDREQYVGKEIIAKGKGTIEIKKNKKGGEYKSTRFTQLISIEVKGEAVPVSEKVTEELKEVK